MKTFLAKVVSEYSKSDNEDFGRKYPLLKGQYLRFLHNEILIRHINCLRKTIQKKSIKMLDLGCGYNYQLMYSGNPADTRLGVDYLPLDESEDFEQLSKEFNAFPAEYKKSNIETFESHEKYDIIICSEVAEHVLSPTNLFAKISTHLSKDGYAIISFPNVLQWRERVRFLLFGKFSNYPFEEFPFGHTNIYTPDNFKTLVGLQNLKIIKRLPSFYFPVPGLNAPRSRKCFSNLKDYGVIYVCQLKD